MYYAGDISICADVYASNRNAIMHTTPYATWVIRLSSRSRDIDLGQLREIKIRFLGSAINAESLAEHVSAEQLTGVESMQLGRIGSARPVARFVMENIILHLLWLDLTIFLLIVLCCDKLRSEKKLRSSGALHASVRMHVIRWTASCWPTSEATGMARFYAKPTRKSSDVLLLAWHQQIIKFSVLRKFPC
jgi:hypothetical protein